MARLFSKDYHDRSNSWYFNHAVIPLAEGDLWFWHTVDEAGKILFRFFPTKEKREYFSKWVELLYDPESQRVLHHFCAECKEEEDCRHYLSLLHHAYHYLSDDILNRELVQTCDSDSLRGSVQGLESSERGRLEIEGIYNPETDKVRVYHGSYQDLDLSTLIKSSKRTAVKAPPVGNNLALSDYELELFAWLEGNRAAYSSKSKFWSIYKSKMPLLLSHLEPLAGKVRVRETQEDLVFATQPYPLALRIERAGASGYSLSPVLVDELSIWFAGYPSWLFFRNKVHKVWLPFRDQVTDSIFTGQMILGDKDLIYYRSIVHKILARQDIYLDFDSEIPLPRIIDNDPICRIYIRSLGDKISLEGSLIYSEDHEIPISVLRFGKPLIYTNPKDSDPEDKYWYYLPPYLADKVQGLVAALPMAQIDHLEQNARLVYPADHFSDLQKAIFQLSDKDWDVVIDDDLSTRFINKIKLEVEFTATRSEDIDWFSYEISYKHADISFSHEELKRYFRSSEDFLHTVDGRLYFISNPELFHEMDMLVSKSKKADDDDVYRARILNLPYYHRLREENPAFKMMGDKYLENLFEDLKRRSLSKTPELPYYLQTVLRGYQKAGVAWLKMLMHHHLNGILADEMGLGKTIQALSVILSAPEDTVSMVICPKTLTYNWAAEIEKFHTNIPYAIVEGNKENRTELLQSPNIRLFLIGYSMVLSDYSLLKKMKFEWIVLDEAQNIKNVSAQRTSVIKKLQSRHRLALSGTPIENKLTELWSIMDFLMPGYLGSLKNFKEIYVNPEDDRQARLELHRATSPFLLRRVKKEVLLELPDKQEQVSWCKMSPIQEKLYLQVLESVQKRLMPESGEELSYVHILAALTKLRQICNHPHLANQDLLPSLEVSSKLELLVELVQDSIAAGHKVLVFSQFVQMLKIMRNVFDALDLSYSYLDGKTKDRVSPVEEFENNENLRLFLISLKTGGTGLNLTAADTVILYDPWWNPMVENQAIDRAHRIGQSKKVQVFRLITKSSVEEKILALQQNKLELFNEVISGGTGVLKTLSLDELKELFSY